MLALDSPRSAEVLGAHVLGIGWAENSLSGSKVPPGAGSVAESPEHPWCIADCFGIR